MFFLKCLAFSVKYSTYVSIRGHRPNYSLGVNFLANREGDYESCFREGEETTKQGMGRVWEENFSLPIFCMQNQGVRKKS